MLRTGPITTSQYEFSDRQFGSVEPDPVNMPSVLRFFKRHWRTCALWAAIGLAIGLAFVLFSHSYYTASATLLLEDRTVRPFPDASANLEATDTAYADSQVQVLQSKEVIGRVVNEYNLIEDDEFGRSRGLRTKLLEALPFLSLVVPQPVAPTKEVLQYMTINRVNAALSIQRVGISNAVDIRFTSRDPMRAAGIANAVAKAYIDSRLELRQQAREDAAAQLRERLAEAREKAFGSEIPSQDRALKSPETGDQARERFRELQNTTETYRVLYNSFLQRYTETLQQLSVPGARVITPAEPPLERSWPSTFLVAALGAIGGAMAGLSGALVKQLADRSLHTGDDLHKATGLDCLAQVELIKPRSWKAISEDTGELQEPYVKEAAALSDTLAKAAVYLQATRVNSNHSTIGLAAVQERGGASSVAAHLARVFAQSGQRTLLIDANWKASSPEHDAAFFASGRKILEKLVTVDLVNGFLDVLVIRGDSAVTDLNASQAIATAILRMQAEYACIVVDFHALDKAADVAASISLLDDVILVAEAGRTTTEVLLGALRSLPREKISVILNKAYA